MVPTVTNCKMSVCLRSVHLNCSADENDPVYLFLFVFFLLLIKLSILLLLLLLPTVGGGGGGGGGGGAVDSDYQFRLPERLLVKLGLDTGPAWSD